MFNWVMNAPLNLSYEFIYNLVILQKCGAAGCRILYLLKQGGERAYRLHDDNGRYAVPVREGTTTYTDVSEIKTHPTVSK